METWIACIIGLLLMLSFTLVPFLYFYFHNKKLYRDNENAINPIDAMLNGDCDTCEMKFDDCVKNNKCKRS